MITFLFENNLEYFIITTRDSKGVKFLLFLFSLDEFILKN